MPEIVASKYELAGQTFTAKEKSFAVLEVGDSKQPEFYPQVKLARWDNEVNFSARLVHEEETPQVSTGDGKIKWLGAKVEAHFYDTGSLKENEGGYEFEIVLKEPPKSNVIRLTLQTKGLDFLYQPHLTIDEITRGAQRPENVVGSYAVYHSSMAGDYTALGGQNYKAGKAFHIYRPRIEDATGAWCWGELNIDARAGLLTVTIPQEWLDKAVYPVRHAAGLEFGYTTAGGTSKLMWTDHTHLCKATSTPASSGPLSSISCYLSDPGTDHFNPALYSDSSGSPLDRLAYLNSGGMLVGSSASWITTNLSYANITSGSQYWLGLKGDPSGSTQFTYYYDTSVNNEVAIALYVTTWPNPWTAPLSNKEKISIYATYAAGGGVSGILAGTLSAVTGSLTGAHGVAGSVAGVLATTTGVFSGAHGVAGSATGMLAPVTGSALGTVRVEGGLAGELAPVTGQVVGSHGVAGTLVGTLAAVTGEMSGTVAGPGEVTGTLAGVLAAVIGSMTGAHGVAGQLAATLAPVLAQAGGWVRAEGPLSGVLSPLIGAITGKHGVSGALAGTLGNVTGAMVGEAAPPVGTVTGVVAGELRSVAAAITGIVGTPGPWPDAWPVPARLRALKYPTRQRVLEYPARYRTLRIK